MIKKVFLITALLFLIASIGAVCAEDINQTDSSLETDSSDVLSVDDARSFTNLSTDIDNSPDDRIDIISDYKFNDLTDKGMARAKDLIIDGGTYTINGNNHIIDADNKAGVFKFTNGRVIINNLKIKNANSSSIILYNCELQTNNVTFENNNDPSEGAAIYAQQSNYYSSHDRFINNHADNGASIYSKQSIIDIDNSTFISSSSLHWSMIYSYNSITTVKNTVFTNMSSKYATVIYCEKNRLTVLNSRFVNLYANATAGAIGCKETDSVTIDGCSFINVTSAKNAGAFYADLNGDETSYTHTITVTGSLFENCSSNFAGAYLQLGGKLNIVNCDFVKNTARYNGGVLYLSNTSTLIGNSRFSKNTAEFNGGVAFIDDSSTIITSCDFKNNNATNFAGAIYLYDSKYEIKNSFFIANSDEVIVSFFDRKGSVLKNNEMNGAKTLLNQLDSNTIVEYEGKKIILNPTNITDKNASSARFDLRDYTVNGHTLAGVVKNQGYNGACWVFGATGALESAFLKATGILLDLSENNIQGAASRYSDIGDTHISEGGYAYSGMGLFLAWLSVLSAEFDTYDELGKISIAAFAPYNSYHIQDAVIIPERSSALDNEKLKEALVNYGGVTVHLYGAAANNDYYNPVTHAQYYNGQDPGNHFVTLVGWDDNYSKNNFKITPAGDGAWICKNSWGTDWGESGYFYVSYYDTTFATGNPSVAYIIKNTENYTRLYQYDIGYSGFFNDNNEIIRFVNTYDAIDNELINAVGTYFKNAGDDYTIRIFVDEGEVYSQSGKSTHAGFETIVLDKKVAVNSGHKFSVMIEAKNMPLLEKSRIHFEPDTSMAYYTDGIVDNFGKFNKTACIKVYTTENPNPEKAKTQYYDKNSNTEIYSNADGKNISIMKDGRILGTATVTGGKATFNMTLTPDKYSIITQYDDEEIVEIFEVKNTIEVIESVKIGYNTKLEIESKFYDSEGTELFDRTVTLQLDGVTYTGKIENNEGLLYITLTDLSIGTHTLVLKNPETLEETTTAIEVVSRFSENSNVNMYYGDAAAFKVRIFDSDGNPVSANQVVTMTLNKATYNVKTNSNGYAVLNIPTSVKPGTYTITASYAGQTIKNTVKVTQVLKLTNVKVKKSAKKLVITATLKKGKTPIKNKKLTFKFNGKKYTAKTNKKGVAKITVKKSVLKKLKVGKKVKYQATYIKDTVTKTVKVKK